MKYEPLHNITLPKIGFGTWKIGGGSYPDPTIDSVSLTALHTAFEIGYTHFDTAEMYASGHSEELVGQAIREAGADREKLFITSKVLPSHLKYDEVLNSCENSLRRLKMDYIDLYLIHWPGTGIKYEESFRALNKLVIDGKVKYLGVSNFDTNLLKHSQSLSETPIITNQVPYSPSDRSYVQNGVLEYCQQNDILFTAYSPVEEGRLKVNQALRSVAEAHNATPYQIALAWVISQPRVITIPMSHNPQHIKENFEAADIKLSQSEINQITNG
ncbi:MAG TPA: aldo/keto reductase [Anaerolineales bacterium]|nr:aldo/keto reductase [Anaerolineales bacterium]